MPCDWGYGSYCATMAKIDITHNINIFIPNQQAGWNNPNFGGCGWWHAKVAQIQNLPTMTNPVNIARNKSKIDYFNCMAENCGCTPPLPPNRYGCMDDGDMPLSYMNNRGMWDFQTLNNTTSSGVVVNPTSLAATGIPVGAGSSIQPGTVPGVQYGSPYQAINVNTGQPIPAANYDPQATVDDGSCFYGHKKWQHGCMDSTPHDPQIHTGSHGFPDTNGHGTNAVYDCFAPNPNVLVTQVNPIVGDPCGSGPGTPCTGAASNTGYHSKNFNPCANFSCSNPNVPHYGQYQTGEWGKNPAFASDMNWWFTHHEDDPNQLGWTQPTSNPPGQQEFRLFGDTSCCDYPPPPGTNPDITYDFRLQSYTGQGGGQAGGIRLLTYSDLNNPGSWSTGIGGDYLYIAHSRWDVVGNEMFVSEIDWSSWMSRGTNALDWYIPSTTPNIPFRIRVYDIYKNLLADYEYEMDIEMVPACSSTNLGGLCWHHSTHMLPGNTLSTQTRKVSQIYPDPIQFPNHVVNLKQYQYSGGEGRTLPIPSWPPGTYVPGWYTAFGQRPAAYVRLDSPLSGTTVDTQSVLPVPLGAIGYAPQTTAERIPSTHWTTPRGNTANLTNMWTGQNFNADPNLNPYPGGALWPIPSQGQPFQNANMGWHIPHSCHSCQTSTPPPGATPTLMVTPHWLEPGPNDWTPGNWFFNNQIPPHLQGYPTSVHENWLNGYNHCGRYVPALQNPNLDSFLRLGTEDLRDCDGVNIKTKITYDKDENQEVTITSDINLT